MAVWFFLVNNKVGIVQNQLYLYTRFSMDNLPNWATKSVGSFAVDSKRINILHPGCLTVRPSKMVVRWLEDDPFLLGFGHFSGAIRWTSGGYPVIHRGFFHKAMKLQDPGSPARPHGQLPAWVGIAYQLWHCPGVRPFGQNGWVSKRNTWRIIPGIVSNSDHPRMDEPFMQS